MIFYFTATGNCLYAAQEIQKKIGGELYSIPNLIKENRYDFNTGADEYVGFVFPVFFLGLPDIVLKFAENITLKNANTQKTFIIATMGKTTGSSCEQLERELLKKGIPVGYKFSVSMPDNYIPIFTMPTKEKAKQHLDKAQKELEMITQTLTDDKPGDYNRSKGPLSNIVSPVIHSAYPRDTKKFFVNDDCDGCSLCERICPVNAIEIKNDKPQWVKANCETCLACLHRCPQEAIQRGKDSRRKGRYTNPRVSLAK